MQQPDLQLHPPRWKYYRTIPPLPPDSSGAQAGTRRAPRMEMADSAPMTSLGNPRLGHCLILLYLDQHREVGIKMQNVIAQFR